MVTIDDTTKSDFSTLTTAEQDEIINDVELLSSTGFSQLSRDRKVRAIRDALGESETIYSGDMSRFPTLDGEAETFLLNLSAHKMELAEGGEPQSESGEGGSASYNQGNPEDYLDLTRFGRTAKRHIRNEESVGIVRSWY
jgi:hypothetical protein